MSHHPGARTRTRADARRHAAVRRSSAAPVAPAEQLKNGEKDVQQVEIDLHRRRHVIVFAVRSGPHDPPCVEHEQSAEYEDRSCRQSEGCDRIAEENVQQARRNLYTLPDAVESYPRT